MCPVVSNEPLRRLTVDDAVVVDRDLASSHRRPAAVEPAIQIGIASRSTRRLQARSTSPPHSGSGSDPETNRDQAPTIISVEDRTASRRVCRRSSRVTVKRIGSTPRASRAEPTPARKTAGRGSTASSMMRRVDRLRSVAVVDAGTPAGRACSTATGRDADRTTWTPVSSPTTQLASVDVPQRHPAVADLDEAADRPVALAPATEGIADEQQPVRWLQAADQRPQRGRRGGRRRSARPRRRPRGAPRPRVRRTVVDPVIALNR